MNQNPPLTPEEAKNLTFPCLLEVWGNGRSNFHRIVTRIDAAGRFITSPGANWSCAALPSPEITEAMRKQFAPQSEYPKRMLVWDGEESEAQPRIVLADLGEKANGRYIVVARRNEEYFQNGQTFDWTWYSHAKPIPEPDQIAQEITEIRQRLAELEAKHNQQIK